MQKPRTQTRPTFSTLLSEALQQRLALAHAKTGKPKYVLIEECLDKCLPKWKGEKGTP